MTSADSRITIHMLASLDGYIANKANSVDWMEITDRYEKGVTLTQDEIADFVSGIDCYVMGSHTYEHALTLGWPYGDTPVIVLTSRALSSVRGSVSFHTGELTQLVEQQLKPRFKNIWMVGGAYLAREFIRQRLVDEIVLSIMPVILGDGLLFFDRVEVEQKLRLKDAKAYKNSIVELTYEVKKD